MTTLGDAEALANTYESGSYETAWDRVQLYRDVVDVMADHPNRASAAIASRLDVARSQIREWVDGDSNPDPARAIETPTDRGWLDADPSLPTGRALVRLVARIVSSGSIADGNYTPTLPVRDADERARAEAVLRGVGVRPETHRDRADHHGTELRPADDRTDPAGRDADGRTISQPETTHRVLLSDAPCPAGAMSATPTAILTHCPGFPPLLPERFSGTGRRLLMTYSQ